MTVFLPRGLFLGPDRDLFWSGGRFEVLNQRPWTVNECHGDPTAVLGDPKTVRGTAI